MLYHNLCNKIYTLEIRGRKKSDPGSVSTDLDPARLSASVSALDPV